MYLISIKVHGSVNGWEFLSKKVMVRVELIFKMCINFLKFYILNGAKHLLILL